MRTVCFYLTVRCPAFDPLSTLVQFKPLQRDWVFEDQPASVGVTVIFWNGNVSNWTPFYRGPYGPHSIPAKTC